MRKHDVEPTEYTPVPDSSTYQTGSAKPQSEHRGLIAVLMILVTFLGGIASAMGLLNIRLLYELAENNAAVENVSVYNDGIPDSTVSQEFDELEPSAPKRSDLELPLSEAKVQPDSPDLTALTEQTRSSIVSVYSDRISNETSASLGVIFDEDGYILTNAYPIAECNRVFVQLSDGRRFRATVVGIDEFTDLAVLYISAQELTVAQFAKSASIGDAAIAFSPDLTAVQGSVCQTTAYSIGSEIISLLQTDFSDLSGPIYNAAGQIIGFSSPFLNDPENTTAVPSITVKEIAEQIISQGIISGRPSLGVELEEIQPLHQQFWEFPQGLRIVREPSQSDSLNGLLQGDILISLNGQSVSNRESLYAVLRTLRPGQQIEAVVIRQNNQITVELTIQPSGE